ncbi:MAG: hypothetical protein Q7S82_01915 [bacterium]|nr:hypothetical protein [bacterium]
MNYNSKDPDRTPSYSGQRLIILAISGILMAGFPILGPFAPKTEAELLSVDLANGLNPELALIERNTLLPISSLHNPEIVQKIPVIITGYSSTLWETDDTPNITASNTNVREGIIANNLFPFGTKIRIPALYGNKIFVVEDRMNWKKGNYHFDIWFSSYSEAKNFGAKITYVEVLED